jgi:hypothetical protein
MKVAIIGKGTSAIITALHLNLYILNILCYANLGHKMTRVI